MSDGSVQLNVTCALPGLAEKPVGAAGVPSNPSTLWPALLAIAYRPIVGEAMLKRVFTQPAVKSSALGPMLIPSLSASAAVTVYRKRALVSPVPEYAASRVAVPTPIFSTGEPVTRGRNAENDTVTSIVWPGPYVSSAVGELVIRTPVTQMSLGRASAKLARPALAPATARSSKR